MASGEVKVATNLIGGVRTSPNRTLERVSPLDGVPVARLPRSEADEVDAAVRAARLAQPGWRRLGPVARAAVIRRAGELLATRREDLAAATRAETGKPLRDALGEVDAAVEQAHFMAGEGRRLYGRTMTSASVSKRVYSVRVPVGVAGLIVASNTPLPNYAWKTFPALVSGNAVVLKPSEDTPLSADLFGEILLEAGAGGGVFNIVHGLGPEAGQSLVAHPFVDVVSFTGGSEAGRRVAAVAGERLAKLCLELGGKNPLLVCEDADLEKAADAAVASAFSNSGQRCAAGSRLLVVDAVYERFRGLLVDRTARFRVSSSPDADAGPVVNERQMKTVLDAVQAAVDRGARVLVGGHRLTSPGEASGWFIAPTVLETDVGDPISRTELFGPVTVLHRVADFDDALAAANDSPFGLTAAVFTNDLNKAMVFTEEASAGMVVVNGPTFGSEPHMPFGGMRGSGNGMREPGTESLDVYCDWRVVSINVASNEAL